MEQCLLNCLFIQLSSGSHVLFEENFGARTNAESQLGIPKYIGPCTQPGKWNPAGDRESRLDPSELGGQTTSVEITLDTALGNIAGPCLMQKSNQTKTNKKTLRKPEWKLRNKWGSLKRNT